MAWLKKYFYLLPVLLYLPILGNFFSGDDWFHLRLAQIDSFHQFINFFSFASNPQTASFFRPLSTQVFFFLFYRLFGLNSVPYYLFGLLLFSYTLYLVKKISSQYVSDNVSSLAVIIYGISVSNFTRLYFISAYQELFLVVFSLLTLINFKAKPKLSLLFFVLALMSKETAIVLPLLIFLLNAEDKKTQVPVIYNLRSTVFVSLVYLYFRLFHFGLAVGDSYTWDFSPLKALNTFMWYSLWSVGAPELLVDYVSSGLKIIPRFFTDYQSWWVLIIFPLLSLVSILFCLFLKNFKKLKLVFWQFCFFYLLSIIPVLFLPAHKFSLELGLPMVGFSISLSILLSASNKYYILNFCFFIFFIFYNLTMNYLTYTRHYSVSRSKIAYKVFSYFKSNYPLPPNLQYFEFVNDAQDKGKLWGQSKQISQSLSGSDFLKVFYQQSDKMVYYQDIADERPLPHDLEEIKISSKQFLDP